MTKEFALTVYCKSHRAKVTDIMNVLMSVLKWHCTNSITC